MEPKPRHLLRGRKNGGIWSLCITNLPNRVEVALHVPTAKEKRDPAPLHKKTGQMNWPAKFLVETMGIEPTTSGLQSLNLKVISYNTVSPTSDFVESRVIQFNADDTPMSPQMSLPAFPQRGKSKLPKGEIEFAKRGNRSCRKGEIEVAQRGKPIPVINQLYSTDTPTDTIGAKKEAWETISFFSFFICLTVIDTQVFNCS